MFPTPTLPATEGAAVPISMEVPRAELQSELNRIVPADPKIALERNLLEGDPPYEILRAATAYQADLIVMGTHGHGGVTRFVMGSVAEAVSRKANCPVVTVRTKAGSRGLPTLAKRKMNPEALFRRYQELQALCGLDRGGRPTHTRIGTRPRTGF